MRAVKQDRAGGIVREIVESSVIRAMGYDADLALLEIEFVSGDLYRYHFVPRRVWNELRNAPSKGAYFANAIREKFPTARVT
ncbi:MAG: KTSC domain-containing protein [Pseudomonadota bacterium]